MTQEMIIATARSMEHVFQTDAHNLTELFTDVRKLNTFISRLERQAELDTDNYSRDNYVGDGFEFFIELLLKLNPNDNRLGVYNYTPKQVDDNGVDGVGKNIINEDCVVQIKFRGNGNYLLTANTDHLSNFPQDAMADHKIIYDPRNQSLKKKNYRHFIFTTAKGLHHYTDNEVFKNNIKCINRNDLRKITDNNDIFWNNVRAVVVEINNIHNN